MQVVRTRRGARLVHGGHVVSEVLARPGPTHSIFDVLAAGVVAVNPAPSTIGMLGFAGGGLLAPLRAMGCVCPVHAVDLSLEAAPVFRELCGPWVGQVQLIEDDALAWLRKAGPRFEVILEDLSAQIPGDVTKPHVSLNGLPSAIHRRLSRSGAVVINALPVQGLSWPELTQVLTRPYRQVQSVRVEGFENRILLAGPSLPSSRQTGGQMRVALRAIRSRLANSLQVRHIR